MSNSKFEYDLSGIDRITGIPTVGDMLVFQRQLAKIQTSYHCKCPNAGNHGWSWLMCTEDEWLLKQGITAAVVPPEHPGPYTGNTHATKFRYKEEIGLHSEYKEHMRNGVKALATCFTEGLLMDLETDGEVIGHTPIEIYDHIKANFLLPRDVSREITKTRKDLRVGYNPDEIPQIYYKKLQTAMLTLAALGDPVMDGDIMRYAFESFEVQSDLKEACRDWDRRPALPLATWDLMKKHFSVEIQRNRTDPSTLHRQEQANAVLERVNAAQEEQQLQQTVLLAQTDKIQELETRLATVQYDQANGASSVGSAPGRIPASISTNDTALTKESMEAMFKAWTAAQAPANPTPTPRTGGGNKQKTKFGTNYIPNDKGDGERTRRRYPDSTSYCSTHGYDIKPNHHSGNCTDRGDKHNELATIDNMLGGCIKNCFHHAGWTKP